MKKTNFIETIIQNAERNSSKVAVVDQDGQRVTTYGRLIDQAKRMAHYLQFLQLPAHSYVLIQLPKSVETIVTELGVWLSGHVIVPVGENYPKERVDYIIRHSHSPLTITLREFEEAMKCEAEYIPIDLHDEDEMQLFYTSGSVGLPKGIIHTFEVVNISITQHGQLVGMDEHTIYGGGAPFYFIAYVFYFQCLYHLGIVHILDDHRMKDVESLKRYIERQKLNAAFISPAILRNCGKLPSCMKIVYAGSEKLSGVAPDGYRLLNLYGMTETSPLVSLFEVDKAYDNTPIGKAVPTCKITIRDQNGNILPQGCEGEICVEGKFAKCYLEDAERTAELYRNGVLHTCDLGRVLPDGNIQYMNRMDWMVKINGQRVEPGEVETVLKNMVDINDAVVKGFTSDTGSQYLCAYYISQDKIEEKEIRRFLRQNLPEYMIPSFFVAMKEFPVNANGKIDRKVLSAPEKSIFRTVYVAPETHLQKQLCDAFAEVLKIERIGLDDDFFFLGGDSVRVIMLQQLCSDLPLSAKMIFMARTPRKLSFACENYKCSSFEKLKYYPLSQTQMGIYAECMHHRGEAVYNNSRLFELPLGISFEQLVNAIKNTIAAHPYVMTQILLDGNGEPQQLRPEIADFEPEVRDMSDDEFQIYKEKLVQPFDILKERLFRVALFRTEKSVYLFIDFHHIIFDGASFEILVEDFNRAFAHETLIPEEYTGCEVAQEEIVIRQSEAYKAAADWYTKQFGNIDLDSLPLPDRKEKTLSFAKSTLRGFDYHALLQYCESEGITMNVLTTAAFGYLLGVYVNLQESLFATIYNGRTDLRSRRTIAMMVKTLPVYCKWEENTTISEYLHKVKTQMLQTMQYDVFSYGDLVAINSCVNSQVLFVYQGFLHTPTNLFGESYKTIALSQNTTGEKLALQLFLFPNNELELQVEYQSNFYTEGYIQRLMECYRQVLKEFLTKKYLNEVCILPENQWAELDKFNPEPTWYDKNQTIVSLFRKAAAQYPEHKALIFNDEVITYREADDISERIAQFLVAQKVGSGDVVSILIPRTSYIAIASIGVLKTTACYQPLDATYPAERLNFMMKDAQAKYLITTHELRNIVNEYSGPVLFLEDIPTLPHTKQILPLPCPDDVFTLLYTSGTTGLPKGCQLSHANLVAFCHWFHRFYAMSSDDCAGAYASYGFDANMMDMYPPLTIGASCCIVGENIRLDLMALNDYLIKNKVTHFFITTQVGRQFAIDYPIHPTLRHLTVGGETLVPFTPPTNYNFYNGYGPTECTICSSIYRTTVKEENFPIGRPVDNARIYIVDHWGHRLPIGAIGEIRITGPQVSLGYLNRQEQTAKVFVLNPFNPDKEHLRMYCTGDIGRYKNDGNLEFIGRRDKQVKIRGFRIELSEVEAVIRQFHDIKDATVAAFEDPNGGKFIAAYVVADKVIDIKSLNTFIRNQKPPYMVPSVTMQIDKIPLNQNMKVNYRALPKPELQIEQEKGGQRIPNILEEQLQSLIGEYVHMEKVPFNTELSYLGLTSISSIKLSAVLYKKYHVNILSRYLIKEGTLLSIENMILQQWLQGSAIAKTSEPSEEVEVIDASPLTYSQQGVYYDCMKRPTEMIYNIPVMLFFKFGIDADTLEKAVRDLLFAHPSLLCHFEVRNQEVMQIRDQFEIKVDRIQLAEDELQKYKRTFVKPFNLAKAPLFRIAIVTTEKGIALLLDFHHIIFDGASMDLFMQELKHLLEGDKPIIESYSFFKYGLDERKAEQSEKYKNNQLFFHNMLSTCNSASEIPADLKGRAEDGHLQEYIKQIPHQQMAQFCHEHQLTPAALCLAAAFYTVSRYVNSKDVYISTISNGRSDIRTADTFGMFVKTLPLGIHIKNQKVKDFVTESALLLSDTIEHEVYPFARIANEYNFSPTIVYVCQLGVLRDLTVNGQLVEMESLEMKNAKFHLSIHIEEREGNPSIVLQYNDALYSKELMESFAISMAFVLGEMMRLPDKEIKNLSLLDPKRALQVAEFRNTGVANVGLYHEAIERQAEKQPDHIALIATDATYTYKEVNAIANRIAHALIERGVRCGDRVALLLPRTSRIILSMFGVMKSGAAYIPCDPEYPVERIQHILNDSDAAYIVTNTDHINSFEQGKAIDVEELLENNDESNPHTDVTPENLAYLIYTSGSTGKPKGVMLRHAGICNYLIADPRNVHVHALVAEAHVFLSVTTVSFDMSLKEIGTTLYNGLTLVLANEQEANNPVLLAKLLKKNHVDAFNATPSRMMQYIELPEFREALKDCKVIMCGGEKYPDQLLVRLRESTTAKIFNTYGPTEITVSSNGKDLTHSDVVTIGRPLLNYQEFVVDSDGNELPPHVIGELYIGGVGVASGYQNLEKMTAERFVEYEGIRVYKTGDYARWTSDGEIVILGRTDTQVKLRGLRIELGEVESCIMKYPGIRNAVVLIRKINKTEHLCAYFIAEEMIDVQTLKDELKKTLALYMVPTAYQQLDNFPLTPNGKVDVKSLPEPLLFLTSGGEAPANETERCFCDIFSEILHLEKVGATDNFFELGGTSLSVASIIIDANKAGYTVAYGDVFTNPTPRKLAALFLSDEEKLQLDPEITQYDYDKLSPILEGNNLEAFRIGKRQKIGNVLLTGATGFLGIHILQSLLKQEEGTIYCLLRSKKDFSAVDRLKTTLFYYFDNSYEELFNKRLFVIEGDVTRPETILSLENKQINSVFHCAANVKHFAADNQIERVNVGGVKNLLDFCERTGARMIHISTMSVSGLVPLDHPLIDMGLTEDKFYFNQSLGNKYVRSKFLAERLILERILEGKVSAKIMRVGNLSARSTDGEFQINFTTNTFMGRLKSFCLIGKCAYDVLDSPLEFSPIDEVAKAIIVLSTTPKECCVFHPFNHHFILLGDVLNLMSKIGLSIEPVEAEEYQRALADAESNPEKAKILSSMIAYQNMGGKEVLVQLKKNNTYTMQVLYRLGYHWPITSWDYVNRFLKSINGLGFFDESDL